MTDSISGLHHVTAIAGDPEANVTFYTQTLGLRFVKRTVNFDDVSTYHLYYGDETGSPGTVLTFFPFEHARAGVPGAGQATASAFAVPDGSLDYWRDRFDERGVDHEEPTTRFGETVLAFRDHDGQPLELVGVDAAETADAFDPWREGPVPADHAIAGFHGVTLSSLAPAETGSVLELLGYERTAEAGDRARYVADGEFARVVDVLDREGYTRKRQATGTVHHVAFRTEDEQSQQAWRDRLIEAGLNVTPVKDRQYFRSIYFREPGGVLFEIATEGPGFTADEDASALGSSLKLPPWLEDDRERIAADLSPLSPPEVATR
jgi:glyoxalase family protein